VKEQGIERERESRENNIKAAAAAAEPKHAHLNQSQSLVKGWAGLHNNLFDIYSSLSVTARVPDNLFYACWQLICTSED